MLSSSANNVLLLLLLCCTLKGRVWLVQSGWGGPCKSQGVGSILLGSLAGFGVAGLESGSALLSWGSVLSNNTLLDSSLLSNNNNITVVAGLVFEHL